jgi:hypothetical protein
MNKPIASVTTPTYKTHPHTKHTHIQNTPTYKTHPYTKHTQQLLTTYTVMNWKQIKTGRETMVAITEKDMNWYNIVNKSKKY